MITYNTYNERVNAHLCSDVVYHFYISIIIKPCEQNPQIRN